MSLSSLSALDSDIPEPYHKGRPSRTNAIPPARRKFVAWDGEGMTKQTGKPQLYTLFGCSTGDYIENPDGLRMFDILDFIIDVGIKHPDAYHVGFAFGYDSNMIVRGMMERNLRYLHEKGHCRLRHPITKQTYVIMFRKGKWFSVTRQDKDWDRKSNPAAKITVRIYDIFGFFTCSFVKAVKDMLGDVPELATVIEGKARRGDFDAEGMEYVRHYWSIEIKLLARVAEELRRRMWGAGLEITQWHGPGALASYALRREGIKAHMKVNDPAIREAARYGYAGGRFELFKIGRTKGPIYSVDINSAYPYGIAQLPSLTEGEWTYEQSPKRIAKFGIYHVRLHSKVGFDHSPGPLFHRDREHNISYPWVTEGWYWAPEVAPLVWQSQRGKLPGFEVVEGWHYSGATTRPFSWVNDTYQKRREWKAKGNASQLALKLLLNSLYGKMAQRVGWDEERNRLPPWHQLEWAGWVTANTRAMLYEKMKQIPWSDLIAVETDGIYTTYPPELLGIQDSAELGGWEVTQYDEIIYIQSGLAWLRKGDDWTCKRRGLDPDSLSLTESIEFTKTLAPNSKWAAYVGKTTRFIGMGAALNSQAPTRVRHCVWETSEREISPGEHGKRIHFPGNCHACLAGESAYDMAHDLVIRSRASVHEMSTPHSIPWEGKDGTTANWREYETLHADEYAEALT
jgi:hypothetical protein